MEEIIMRLRWAVCERVGLDIHPTQLMHEWYGELDRDVNDLELGEAGA